MRIFAAIAGFLLFLGVIFSAPIIHFATMDTVQNVEFVEKYTKRRAEKDDYMVVIEKQDGTREVLENTDSILAWKFNSATVQANLDEGSMCKELRVNGWRAGFFSWNRNIVDMEGC